MKKLKEEIQYRLQNMDRVYILRHTIYNLMNKETLLNLKREQGLYLISKPVYDITLTFQVIIIEFDSNVISIGVNKELLQQYHISEEVLLSQAHKNTVTWSEFELLNLKSYFTEQALAATQTLNHIWVATNKNRTFGSNILLYPEKLKPLAEELQDDLYVIPSDAHHVFLIPKRDLPIQEVFDVKEASRNSAKSILSDQIYQFERCTNQIILCENTMEEK